MEINDEKLKIEFTGEELEELRQFYRDELRNLLKKIEKVSAILEKLGSPTNIDVSAYKKKLIPSEIYAKQIIVKPNKEENVEEVKIKEKQKREYRLENLSELAEKDPSVKEFLDLLNDESIPLYDFGSKKREKKSQPEKQEITEIIPSNYRRSKNILWSDYVYDKLKLVGYPLTVEELKNEAIKDLNLDETESLAAFSAIHSALFRLKRNQKAINNYAIKGSRTSYYGLVEWFTKEGKLLKKYSRPY